MIEANARLQALQQVARTARSQVDRRKGEREKLLEQQRALAQARADAEEAVETTKRVILFLAEVASFARNQAREQVEGLATLALQSVFGPGYRFVLEATKRGNNDEIKCSVVSPYGGEEIKTEGTDSRGGGIVDIQALALRIAMLETYRTPAGETLDGALLLDEPGKHVSKQYIGLLARFIKAVSEQFERQMILVTHNEELAASADAQFNTTLVDGASQVTKVAA